MNIEPRGSRELNCGKVSVSTACETNEWKHTFEDLPVNKGGAAIEYDIDEVSVENYTTEKSGDAETGFTITNTPDLTEVSVKKVWNDEEILD